MEQIRGHRIAQERSASHPIVVRVAGKHFVECVDPHTMQTTGVPQQFTKVDSTLTILKAYNFVSDPDVIDVDTFGC